MELTTRERDLYNFLKENKYNPRYISKREIALALPEHYNSEETHSRYLTIIESDVKNINYNVGIEDVIVSSKIGYKIGNEKEIEEYIKKRFERDFKSLKFNFSLVDKLKEKSNINNYIKDNLNTKLEVIENEN